MAIVSWLGWLKNVHAVSRKLSDRVLTFEQMAACCQHNWVLRGNFLSGIGRKLVGTGNFQRFMQFPTISCKYFLGRKIKFVFSDSNIFSAIKHLPELTA